MRRRELICLLGAMTLSPLVAVAEVPPKRRPLIAWLAGGTIKGPAGTYPANFLDGIRELGYVDGRDVNIVYHFAEGLHDRLPALAQEVVQLKPNVILAAAVNAAVAARNATSMIPIVCPALADAVHLGLIGSEARPGGNVTGIEPYVAGLPAKQMQFAREIAPGDSRVGLLTNLQDPKVPPQWQELQTAAKALEMTVVEADISRPEEIEGALNTLASQRVDVVVVVQSTLLLNFGERIAALALAKRLLTVYGYREHVVAGGLISYGVDLRWCFRRGAYFVDKILRGTPPSDLPVEFPTKMILSINLQTAKALGITVPHTVLDLADEVIE